MVKGCLVLGAVRDLFKGAYNNTLIGEGCTVNSRERTKQGRRLIEEYGIYFTKYKFS